MNTSRTFSRRIWAYAPTSALFITVVTLLTGCDATTQTTSGQRYLERYPTATGSSQSATNDIDRLVAEAAAVEPTLRFPARIGLARIQHGMLVNVPAFEGEHWLELREKLGVSFGEFVPVNLVVAETVYAGSGAADTSRTTLANAIARVRLGAARQHLDAVLIYEVAVSTDVRQTGFSVIDWTIIGAYARTSRAHAEAYATALLIDVRNGYPYGTAVAACEDLRSASSLGSENRLDRQTRSVTDRAVATLAPEVETMFRRLMVERAAQAP